jgi:hypothetical protein
MEQTTTPEEKNSMAMKIRRIVTGHHVSGKAIVKTDEQLTAVPRVAAGISGCEIWSTKSSTFRGATETYTQFSRIDRHLTATFGCSVERLNLTAIVSSIKLSHVVT